tara:strand:- start:83 stop:283 length:201 start_codon:yes stop_codon:yes gene_type:complete
MNEVFIAKNGRPYVKDENGKVRFISSAEWEEYKSKKVSTRSGKWLVIALFITLSVVYVANNIGDLL